MKKAIYIIMLVCLINVAFAYTLTTNITSYWSYDDNADDDSGNNNNASSINANKVNSCKLRGCYNMSGSGNIHYDDSIDWVLGNSFTISLWVNIYDVSGAYVNYLMSQGTGDNTNRFYYFWQMGAPGSVAFTNWVASATNVNIGYSTTPSANTWYHLVLRANGTHYDVYRDNTRIGSTADSDGIPNHAGNLTIGSETDSANYLKGLIDEVAIWNRSLNLSEISELYNSGDGYNPYYAPTGEVYSNITNYANASANFTVSVNHSNILGSVNCSIYESSTNISCQDNPTISNKTNINCTFADVLIRETQSFKPYCYNSTDSYNGTAQSMLLFNAYEINFTAKYQNGTNVEDFNISYSWGSYQASGDTLPVYVWFGDTETFTFYHPNAVSPNTVTLTPIADQTYEFSVYKRQSVNITFLDEENENIVDYANITVEIINNLSADNYSTTNGTLLLNNLSSLFTTIRYRATSFYERFYYVNLSDVNEVVQLTLYMLNSSVGDTITLSVFDNTNENVEEAYVRMLRYYIDDNSYKVVEMALTNDEGDAILHAIQNDEFYQFLVYKPFSSLVGSSVPSYIRSTTPFIQVDLIETMGEEFDITNDVIHTLTFNNATNNFRLTFSNLDAEDTTVTLNTYKVGALGKTLVNSSTTTSSAGTLLAYVPPNNDTLYVAEAVISFPDMDQVLDTADKAFDATNPFQTYGLGLTWFMTVLAALAGIWNIGIAVIFVGLINIVAVIAGLLPLSLLPVSIALAFVSIVVVLIMGKDT